jgi:hypothetical protein
MFQITAQFGWAVNAPFFSVSTGAAWSLKNLSQAMKIAFTMPEKENQTVSLI